MSRQYPSTFSPSSRQDTSDHRPTAQTSHLGYDDHSSSSRTWTGYGQPSRYSPLSSASGSVIDVTDDRQRSTDPFSRRDRGHHDTYWDRPLSTPHFTSVGSSRDSPVFASDDDDDDSTRQRAIDYQQPFPQVGTTTTPSTTLSRYLDTTAQEVKPYVPKTLHHTGRSLLETAKTWEHDFRKQNPRLSSKLSSMYSNISQKLNGRANRLRSMFSSKSNDKPRYRHTPAPDTGTNLALMNMNMNVNASNMNSVAPVSRSPAGSISGISVDSGAVDAGASCLSGFGSFCAAIFDGL